VIHRFVNALHAEQQDLRNRTLACIVTPWPAKEKTGACYHG
jgi:hypothetical protein